MMPLWAVRALVWVLVGLVYGVLVLYRRPQVQGAACLFVPFAVFAWPLLIVLDLAARVFGFFEDSDSV